MVDTLAFMCSHVDMITGYLTAHDSPFTGILAELFEVYAILLPFACFARAVEMRTCSLPMIVPLARQLLWSLSDVGGLMRTCTAMAILRGMHVCILAGLSANNRHEALVAYPLALARREDTPRREIGYRTRDTTTRAHHPSIDERCNLKLYVRRGDKYDDVMFSIYQMISNTNLLRYYRSLRDQ
jgi:hypothetical protein